MFKKRSMFKMIFGRQPPRNNGYTVVQMLNSFQAQFTPSGKDIYNSDTIRSAIDAIARNGAKFRPVHVREANGKITQVNSKLEQLLQVRPNKFMDAYTFLYKVITELYVNNNSFIYIDFNSKGEVEALYPIQSSNSELLEYENEVFCRFTFLNGQRVTLPYDEIIHLRRFFYKDEFWGETNNKTLQNNVEALNTAKQGVRVGIKLSNLLRGLLKFNTMLKDEDIEAQKDKFVNNYLDLNNSGGIAALDAKAEYKELKSESIMPNKTQMDFLKNEIYNYYGVSEKIVQSNYTEEEWNAFYESTLEPLALQLSLQLTDKLFTKKERGFGNRIILESNRLQYASMKTKIQTIKELLPLGVLSQNDALRILNLPPIEGGEKRIISLNYIDVDIARKYQVGEDKKEGEENGEE
ncbi:hypothetical protein Z957_05205 [Clostridium sp. K25]|uniref:phage portal protein n=1 Tax=Clostridium sp. K25 TaxID=1443109 RepID=UPI0004D42519|nr:phage portal protein [Clostridium sp. K25]KEI09301.1 hypothetical protein Z957_05205 [Clostridium sp. K25]